MKNKSKAYKQFEKLLRELHKMIEKGTDESDAGEEIRDKMDAPWSELTSEERKELGKLSIKLYEEKEQIL